MQICGDAIMNKHWHLPLRPRDNGDLPDSMQWVTFTQTPRYRESHGIVAKLNLELPLPAGERLKNP